MALFVIMTAPEFVDLSVDPISEPLDAYRIGEDRFAVAAYTAARPYMITYGISTCKAITIYNPLSQVGIVAHMAIAPNAERILDKLTRRAGDLNGSDVYVMQAMQSTSANWPTLEDIAGFFMDRNPRSLRLDDNRSSKYARGIALNLADGNVKEIDGSNGWTWSKLQDTSLNEGLAGPHALLRFLLSQRRGGREEALFPARPSRS